MPKLSDSIETFIKELIQVTGGSIDIQRNELAARFKCVPSQINYVLTTRFSVHQGYYVESRRGGGGHITIQRVDIQSKGNYLMHIVSSMGEKISQQAAEIFIRNFLDYDIVSHQEALLIRSAVSDRALCIITLPERDLLRASILKNMMTSLLCR